MVVVVVVVLEVVTVVWGPCNAEEVKNANMHLHECFVGLPDHVSQPSFFYSPCKMPGMTSPLAISLPIRVITA